MCIGYIIISSRLNFSFFASRHHCLWRFTWALGKKKAAYFGLLGIRRWVIFPFIRTNEIFVYLFYLLSTYGLSVFGLDTLECIQH